MTTLKLKNTPAEAAKVKAEKTPVRRADPAKRDRTQAPVRKIKPVEADNPPAERSMERGDKRDSRPPRQSQGARPDSDKRSDRGTRPPRENSSSRPAGRADGAPRAEYAKRDERPARTESPRQRNHRYDGTLRHEDGAPKAERPARPDVRVTPKPSSDEPHYRQAPRRGGKARDGYDATAGNYPKAAKPASKTPTADNTDQPRLSKRMAELGLCSRREADDWIVNGWVKVNGVVVDELGSRVSPEASIEISKEAEKHQAEVVTIILHKPVGYVSGQAEDGYEPASVLIKPENQWEDDPTRKPLKRIHLKGLAPAGRLDIDSTGMLVLTQDGRVARHLIGEDSTVEKEYLVRVEGDLSDEGFDLLNHGLTLDGVKLKPAKVSWQNEDQLRFVLREGRKRQIRRMCELVGLHVVGLKRVRIGSVTLGKLPAGQWRFLRMNERF